MRLTHINLAGFKSFVDPTQIPVPGQLVGIVGPNGCGKSNIIDAVRWVLGESSAKQLRGETMQDVLFNGSGNRKPMGRCSVELIFDNSLGKATGQWSTYAEISVKRVLLREGDSTYYINNLPVRRRDVTDIFLGTGLGARAYAIIEQGMISRIIEAKPEDLRVFLEEAAGVSKYRERRRETELRLRDTRENLVRVEDIRQELTKQIEHLQSQAAVASNYHSLQNELATLQGLLWFTRKKEAIAARGRHNRDIERCVNDLESETARLRETENQLETLRTDHYTAGDALHEAQGALYEANSEVARIEQQINHIRENRQRIEHHLETLISQKNNQQIELHQFADSKEQTLMEQQGIDDRIIEASARLEDQSQKLPQAEQLYRQSDEKRRQLQLSLSQIERQHQVEQTKMGHSSALIEQLTQRKTRLLDELAVLPQLQLSELDALQEQFEQLTAQIEESRGHLEQREQELPILEQQVREHTSALNQSTQKQAAIEARLSVLSQLQANLAKGAELSDWQASRGLDQFPRVWQSLQITPGWETALEAILRQRLNALTVETYSNQTAWLEQSPPGKMTLVALAENGPTDLAQLSDVIPGLTPLITHLSYREARLESIMKEWLRGVYAVSDIRAALPLCAGLPAGSLLVTVEGHILDAQSLSFHAPDTELQGVLTRQREIESIEEQLQLEENVILEARETLAQAQAQIEDCRGYIQETRNQMAQQQNSAHQIQLSVLRLTEQNERTQERQTQIARALEEIAAQWDSESHNRQAAQELLDKLAEELLMLNDAVDESKSESESAEHHLQIEREALDTARQQHQEVQYQQKTIANKLSTIESSLERLDQSIASIQASIELAHKDLEGFDETPWDEQLQSMLETRVAREQVLGEARDQLEGLETRLRALEQDRLTFEQKLDPLRERIAELRLKEQEARLNEEQYTQQLFEANANEEELAALLEKGTRSNALQSEINRINQAITALGAVNLAALEELTAAQERSTYLEDQSRDLSEAMATLEDAIKRIDRETRDRLQLTFDEVNRHFSEMFPALFGGGQAKLTLTGEEILDCGLHVMAQPPGKKNSTIHLLSGGEKALTALSLIFSIFMLNPAPFCLLDEVDAPLDDQNTERFCELVKKMSIKSQFLFISHNKITMEMANQLLGITMQEAGISRVVAVDIEEALKLSEAA